MNRPKEQKEQKEEVTQNNFMILLEYYQEEDLGKTNQLKMTKVNFLYHRKNN
jgi:hypothetical protein